MSHDLSEAQDTDGIHVLVKRGSGPAAARLRAEGETLALARHPGVVELISMEDDLDEVTLHVAQVTGRTLLDHPPLNARQLAAVFAEVSQTLADLHALGIAHTNLGAEHIILDRHLHATLCGFGSASRVDGQPTIAPAAPAEKVDDATRLDVIALGRLLDREVARSLDDQLSEDREPAIIALRHIADLADCATDKNRVVEMHQLARRLHQIAGTVPDDPRPASGGGSTPLLDRLRDGLDGSGRAIGGVLVAAAIAATIFAVWPNGSSAAHGPGTVTITTQRSATASTTAPVSATDDSEEREPSLVLDTRPSCEPIESSAERADVDGDGCDEAWWRVGSVLAVGNERYSLGDPDDLVTLGDWDCDGVATPALVNGSTGDVFLFAAWASDGGSEVAEFVATVDLADTLVTTADGDCDVLTISTTSGESHTFSGGA